MYHRALSSSTFLFAPVGQGNNERKWIEAATLGTIILTDDIPFSLTPLLSGIPSVLVRSWASVTPAALERAADYIQAHWTGYDRMKMLWPQWMYRLQTGVGDLDTASDGTPLEAPYVI